MTVTRPGPPVHWAHMARLGDPPNYSTPRTLGLSAVCLLAALAHFTLGAFDYDRVDRYLGLGGMLLGGLLLVYGVLSVIRYAEAHDAMTDPLPRAPMYDTPHQRMTLLVGVGLNVLGLLVCLAWAVAGTLPLWHLAAGALNLWGAGLAWSARPRQAES